MSDHHFEEYLQKNAIFLKEVETFACKQNHNLFDLPPLDMRIEPGLVQPGETVVVRLSAKGTKPPDGQLTADANYLGKNPSHPHTLNLDWYKTEESTWQAECKLIADRPGNWRFVWTVAGHRLSRILGVIETGQVVITLWGGNNVPRLDQEIHQYDLTADHWVETGFGKTPAKIVTTLKPFARDAFYYGDRLTPICNADGLFPDITDKNLFKVTLDIQRQAIRQLQSLWSILGLKELEVFACYTPSHGTFGLLSELGFKALNSLCVWQNWLDGDSPSDWQINHVGCPIGPYYPAPDDFRKVATGKSLVAFSMGTASSTRCYDIMCFDGAPTNCMGQIRYWRLPGVGSNVHRFFAAVDGWIHDARNNSTPVFATVGLENFYDCHESWKANAESIHYMVRRAREGKLVFASSADIADFYHRHYPVQPEQVYFQPDYMAGMRGWSKPARVPDRIEITNQKFHSLHIDGQSLPQFLWDHTIPWHNPEWDDQSVWRDPYGLVTPETIATTAHPEGCVPRQTDLRGVKASIKLTPDSHGVQLTVRVHSDASITSLPLAIWRIPLDTDEKIQTTHWSPNVHWTPVYDGWSGNLHGVITLSHIPAGETEWSLHLTGSIRPPRAIDFSINGLLAGRTLRLSEETRTYLWREYIDCRIKLHIQVPPESPAVVMALDGTTMRPDATGRIEVVLDERWAHEAPSLVNATPVQCGGDAVITLSRVQPTQMTPHVKNWSGSPAIPINGPLENLAYPQDKNVLQLTPHRIPKDFASLNLGLLKGAKGNSVIYQMARFQTSARAQVCVDLGYEGPVKAWLDGRQIFQLLNGTPPREIESQPEFEVEAGEHELLLAFGQHNGIAWGVRLRILGVGEEVPLEQFLQQPFSPTEIKILP